MAEASVSPLPGAVSPTFPGNNPFSNSVKNVVEGSKQMAREAGSRVDEAANRASDNVNRKLIDAEEGADAMWNEGKRMVANTGQAMKHTVEEFIHDTSSAMDRAKDIAKSYADNAMNKAQEVASEAKHAVGADLKDRGRQGCHFDPAEEVVNQPTTQHDEKESAESATLGSKNFGSSGRSGRGNA